MRLVALNNQKTPRFFSYYKVIYAKHASFLRKKPKEIKKIAYKKF